MTARLPDWAIYGAATCALLLASVAGREQADAPEAPPLPKASEDALIGPVTPFERTISIDAVNGPGAPAQATAFAIAASGRWITSGRLAQHCKVAAVLVGAGQALQAKVTPGPDGWSAILTTDGASTALPLAPAASLQPGARGYAMGYPQGRPGEIALRLVGRTQLESEGHGRQRRPVMVWALAGRTRGLSGPLTGLDGAPVLDPQGRVAGVVLKEARRRGRLYVATPEALAAEAPKPATHEAAPGLPITPDNYGTAADGLRRDLRVAQARCL